MVTAIVPDGPALVYLLPFNASLRGNPGNYRTMKTHKVPPSAAMLIESMRDIGYSLETALAEQHPGAIAGEPLPGGGHRLGVPVETEDDVVPEGLEQGTGMSAASDRPVDQQTGGNRNEGVDHLGDHHRGVGEITHGLGPAPQAGRPERIAD